MPKRRSIPISFKKQVIEYVTERKCSVHAAYMHFKRQGFDYSEACYYRWWKQKEKIMVMGMSRKRCSGGGRPPLLGEWIYGYTIRKMIRWVHWFVNEFSSSVGVNYFLLRVDMRIFEFLQRKTVKIISRNFIHVS